MESKSIKLLEGIILLYRRQIELFRHFSELTTAENQLIQEGDKLALAELLRQEHELIRQIMNVRSELVCTKELFMSTMPIHSLAMDQLACIASPQTYIALENALSELKNIVIEIKAQKAQGIAVLKEGLFSS